MGVCFIASRPLSSTIVLGVTLSLIVFVGFWRLAERTIRLEFQSDAEDIGFLLEKSVDQSLHHLEAVAAFYRASPQVTRSRFREFVTPFLSHSTGIQALEWVPHVPGTLRQAYERKARVDSFSCFQINEKNHEGKEVVKASIWSRKQWTPWDSF
jgi:CHASE1-domain containing sensor protein